MVIDLIMLDARGGREKVFLFLFCLFFGWSIGPMGEGDDANENFGIVKFRII